MHAAVSQATLDLLFFLCLINDCTNSMVPHCTIASDIHGSNLHGRTRPGSKGFRLVVIVHVDPGFLHGTRYVADGG